MRVLAASALLVLLGACQCVVVPDGPYACNTDTGEDCSDGGGLPDDGGAFPADLCGDQWCWEQPKPFGRITMRSVFEVAPDDVWVAGSAGNLAHYNGSRWQQVPTGTTSTLWRVWGADRRAVWVAGANGFVFEWNGQTLVRHDAGVASDLRGIAPAGRRDLHFVGIGGEVVRYDGQQWSRPIVPNPPGSLYTAVGWPDGGLLAMGDFGLQRAGQTWSEIARPTDGGPTSMLWAPTVNDAWACGSQGIFRNTSGDFSSPDRWAPTAFDAGSTSAVFTLGEHVFWSASSSGMYESTTSVPITNRSITSIHGLAENDVWATGPGSLLHRTVAGAFFDDHTPPEIAPGALHGVVVLPGGAAWAVGDFHTVLVRDGGTWSRVRSDGNPNAGYYWDVWTAPGMPVVAVGADPIRLAYWDAGAQRMSSIDPGLTSELWGVWGSSATDIWAVGAEKQIVHYDGNAWNVLPPPAACPELDIGFEDVWGTGPQDVYLVGNHGCILHWTGSSFADESLQVDEVVHGVAGLSANEVWVVTRSGRILRRTGPATWAMESSASQGLRELAGVEGNMYAVGDGAQVLRRDSTGSWRRMVVPVENFVSFNNIHGAPGEGLLTVGDNGMILSKKQ